MWSGGGGKAAGGSGSADLRCLVKRLKKLHDLRDRLTPQRIIGNLRREVGEEALDCSGGDRAVTRATVGSVKRFLVEVLALLLERHHLRLQFSLGLLCSGGLLCKVVLELLVGRQRLGLAFKLLLGCQNLQAERLVLPLLTIETCAGGTCPHPMRWSWPRGTIY